MRVIRYISSDISQEIRPSSLPILKSMIERHGGNSLYPFKTERDGRYRVKYQSMGVDVDGDVIEYLEAYRLNFTLSQVLHLLEKAMIIVSNTEEGIAYTLDKLFVNDKSGKSYRIPPGTLKFFSQNHICFYTGKNWRKIVP
jgi:hypothetical protein